MERYVGNVSEATEITFEFGVRKSTGAEDDGDAARRLPFQLSIEYSEPGGGRVLRVITECRPLTTDRAQAETGETQDNASSEASVFDDLS